MYFPERTQRVYAVRVPVVWLVDPARETVTIYRSLSQTEQLTSSDTITADPVLPGFSCPVARFFH